MNCGNLLDIPLYLLHDSLYSHTGHKLCFSVTNKKVWNLKNLLRDTRSAVPNLFNFADQWWGGKGIVPCEQQASTVQFAQTQMQLGTQACRSTTCTSGASYASVLSPAACTAWFQMSHGLVLGHSLGLGSPVQDSSTVTFWELDKTKFALWFEEGKYHNF